jgi:hypothetical protein
MHIRQKIHVANHDECMNGAGKFPRFEITNKMLDLRDPNSTPFCLSFQNSLFAMKYVQVMPALKKSIQVTPSPVLQLTPSPVQVTPFPDDNVDGFTDAEGFYQLTSTSTLGKAVDAYVIDKETWRRSFDCGNGNVTSTSCGKRYGYVMKR